MLINSIILLLTVLALLVSQTPKAIAEKVTPLINISFQPSPQKPAPYRTGQGGSRGDSCSPQTENEANHRRLKALLPTKNNPEATEFVELTTQGHPTFWLYLPDTPAKQMVLSVIEVKQDNSLHSYAQVFLPVPQKSGIIGVTLPASSPPLEIGKTYLWALVLICGDKPHPNNPTLSAWVRRVNLSVAESTNTPLERAKWFSQRGIWYDALSSLAEARRDRLGDQNLTTVWVNLLNSVGLESIAEEPLQF